MYHIDIMTLFPDTVGDVLSESILGRAQERDYLRVETHQIRDYTVQKQKQVDDYPYGGGRGAILQADPLYRCWEHICSQYDARPHTIFMSPCGKTFTQAEAKRLAADYDHLILVCGHYEGVDQRFLDECVDEEISLGDFVLTGGEIAAMAVADAVCRLVPGVLPDPECFENESHWGGLLEYPQYSRPAVWHGRAIPDVLTSGNHESITRWRRKEQLRRTRDRRPDLFAAFTPLDKLDARLLEELEREQVRPALTRPLICRPAAEADLRDILAVTEQARALLGRFKVDQWQEPDYPGESDFRRDMERRECYALTCGEELAAFFVLSAQPEKSYDAITDGKWSGSEPYAVLHRCAVSEPFRGLGVSDRMLAEAERLTLERGLRWLRTDTHKKNKAMQALLRRNGYQYRGSVLVPVLGDHDPRRLAFEKRLKPAGGVL